MNVLGIDSAVKGIAAVELPSSKYFWLPKEKTFDETLVRFHQWCQQFIPDAVYLEDVTYVRNYAATLKMAKIVGAVQVAFLENKLAVFTVNNMIWKRAVIGDGKATKEDIINFVKASEYFSIPDKDLTDDIADAACLSLFGYLRMHK